jgi:hypothetical protein
VHSEPEKCCADADLARVVKAWPELSDQVRQAILELIH